MGSSFALHTSTVEMILKCIFQEILHKQAYDILTRA